MAARWMRRSAIRKQSQADQAGYGRASFALAEMYRDGSGVPEDVGQAQRLLYRAGSAGLADAFTEGGEIYFDEKQPDYFQAKS
jgi:TPR repeat protein